MFDQLEQINSRPDPFEFYTAADLWTDDHTSKQMLACHLNTDIDVSSHRGELIDQAVAWIGSHFNVGTGYSLNAFEHREETVSYEENLLNGFWSPGKYYGFQTTFKYDDVSVVLDKYTPPRPAMKTKYSTRRLR